MRLHSKASCFQFAVTFKSFMFLDILQVLMRKIQAVTYTRTIVQTTGKHVTPAQNGRVGIRRYRSIALAHGVQGKETFLCLQTYDAAHGCANLSGKRLQGSGRTGPCAESSYSRHSSGPFGHGPLGWNENGFRASPSPRSKTVAVFSPSPPPPGNTRGQHNAKAGPGRWTPKAGFGDE